MSWPLRLPRVSGTKAGSVTKIRFLARRFAYRHASAFWWTMHVQSPATRIVGLGSPHGDDRLGWLAVDRLVELDVLDAQPIALKTTTDLLDHLDGCQHLILIDACQTGAPAGTLFRFEWPDPRLEAYCGRSTHGLGIVDVLRLATALDRCPQRVVLFAVEIASCGPATAASEPVRQTLGQLVERIAVEVDRRVL